MFCFSRCVYYLDKTDAYDPLHEDEDDDVIVNTNDDDKFKDWKREISSLKCKF